MKDLMKCALCGESIIRGHEGQVVVLRNKLLVLSEGDTVRVKCPKCGKLQVVAESVLNDSQLHERLRKKSG